MARILESGIAEMQRGQMFRTFVDQASSHFEELGTPEAQQIAQLIRSDPRGATAYVNQFGGWEQIYNQARANAGRQALTDAIGRLSPANGAVTSLLTQQQVLQQILPVAMKYGVGGDLLGEIAQAYGSAGPRKFDWEHSNPEKYTPESYAAGWQAQDPTLLRSAKPAAPPASVADFTPASIRRWQQTGDIADLVPIPKPAGDGSSAESRALDLEGKRLDLKTKQLKARAADIYERDARGDPISDNEAALVNNVNRMFPNPFDPTPKAFVPRNRLQRPEEFVGPPPDGTPPAPPSPVAPTAPPNPAAAAEERLRARERGR